MRHGRLLVEENPATLMTKFGATLLEDVILQLCHSQELEPCPTNNDMNSWDNNNTTDWNESILNISYKKRGSKDILADAMTLKPYSDNSTYGRFNMIY